MSHFVITSIVDIISLQKDRLDHYVEKLGTTQVTKIIDIITVVSVCLDITIMLTLSEFHNDHQ